MESAKDKIARAFKELMLETDFKKIRISDIAERAGVIRSTFYNYYLDKTGVFEYILEKELFGPIHHLIYVDNDYFAMDYLFRYFDANREFYRRAFKIEGQNCFSEIFLARFLDFTVNESTDLKLKDSSMSMPMTPAQYARYYAISLVGLLEMWVLGYDNTAVEDMIAAAKFMETHSYSDVFHYRSGK